jgi:hypothetical protein
MRNDRDWVLWRQYQSASKRAELLQSMWEGESVLFGVIFDNEEGRWVVNCVDTSQWITKRFHGGHRAYYPEVWRDQ